MGRPRRPTPGDRLAQLASFRNEEERVTVARWVRPDCQEQTVPGWEGRLTEAVERGQRIYRDFHESFLLWFGASDGPGAAEVRRRLLSWHGHADAHMIEAVLERIRDRRLHLLDHLYARTQHSLFAAQGFDPERLPGYLRTVARLESRHL